MKSHVFDTHCHVQDTKNAKKYVPKVKRLSHLALQSVDEPSWDQTINLATSFKNKCLIGK